MNYTHHYNALMIRAKGRRLIGYSERHHIIPKCQGGTNTSTNIVRLTPEEHYVAHQLLVKMYPGNIKLLWAASNMTGVTGRMKRNNKLYGWLRRRLAEMLRRRVVSAETRKKISANHDASKGMKGLQHSEATKAKMSLAAKGKPKSAAHRAALSAAHMGRKTGPHSDIWKANQRAGILRSIAYRDESYKMDPIYRAKQSEQMKKVWEARKSKPSPTHTLAK